MIIFIDVETTGLPKTYNAPASDTDNWPRVVEVAWVLCSNLGEEINHKSCLIRPDGFEIPSAATAIHGITTERAQDLGISIASALDEFTRDIHAADLVVGHNVSFDQKILECEYFRLDKENPLAIIPMMCTMRASTEYCAIETRHGYKWPKLSELYWKLFQQDIVDEHRASKDAEATARCFFELLRIGVIELPDGMEPR